MSQRGLSERELDEIAIRAKLATPGPHFMVQVGRGPCDSPCIMLGSRASTQADRVLFANAQRDITRLIGEIRRLQERS